MDLIRDHPERCGPEDAAAFLMRVINRWDQQPPDANLDLAVWRVTRFRLTLLLERCLNHPYDTQKLLDLVWQAGWQHGFESGHPPIPPELRRGFFNLR